MPETSANAISGSQASPIATPEAHAAINPGSRVSQRNGGRGLAKRIGINASETMAATGIVRVVRRKTFSTSYQGGSINSF